MLVDRLFFIFGQGVINIETSMSQNYIQYVQYMSRHQIIMRKQKH